MFITLITAPILVCRANTMISLKIRKEGILQVGKMANMQLKKIFDQSNPTLLHNKTFSAMIAVQQSSCLENVLQIKLAKMI